MQSFQFYVPLYSLVIFAHIKIVSPTLFPVRIEYHCLLLATTTNAIVAPHYRN